jgi:3-hydroxybutyryl-CoA dehydrogenase
VVGLVAVEGRLTPLQREPALFRLAQHLDHAVAEPGTRRSSGREAISSRNTHSAVSACAARPEVQRQSITQTCHYRDGDGVINSVTDAHTDNVYEEYKEPLYAAPPLLQRMVDAGRLGRKSGSGFYTYA